MKRFCFCIAICCLLASGCSEKGLDYPSDASTFTSTEPFSKDTTPIVLSDGMKYESSEGVSVENDVLKITKGGDFTISGTFSDGMVYVNCKEKVKLRFNGVHITNQNGPAVFIEDASKAYIILLLDTTNYISDGFSYRVDAKGTLFSNDTLEIKGSGALHVVGNYKHGICSDDDIIVEEGNFDIRSSSDGLHANDDITIRQGHFTITAGTDGIESEASVIIHDGTFDITAGGQKLTAITDVFIYGGNLKES